jgi:hypothetical protein
MNRRAFLLASALTLPPLLTLSPGTLATHGLRVADAGAAVSVLISMEELVERSAYVVVATAGERRSAWEDMPSGKRIVTYTKLTVERAVVGAPDKEIWVRTLGGVVDKIGQSVAGEAQIGAGSRGLFFLTQASTALVVTGMAQGHFLVVSDDKGVARLAPSPDPGMLIPRRGPTISAQERLVGGKLDDGVALVVQTRKARDEKK